MARLIPIILIALAVWFWLRTRRKTADYMAAYESGEGVRREREEPQDPAPRP